MRVYCIAQGEKLQSVCRTCIIKLTLKMHSGVILLIFMFISSFQNLSVCFIVYIIITNITCK